MAYRILVLRHGSMVASIWYTGLQGLLQVLALPFGCKNRDNSLECTKGDSRAYLHLFFNHKKKRKLLLMLHW